MKIYIITGAKNSGKSTALLNIANEIQSQFSSIAGYVARSIFVNNKHIGYDLFDIQSKNTIPLMRNDDAFSEAKCGCFGYKPIEFDKAIENIQKSIYSNTECIILDEIGILYRIIPAILNSNAKVIIFTIRKDILGQIIEKYNIQDAKIFDLDSPGIIYESIN